MIEINKTIEMSSGLVIDNAYIRVSNIGLEASPEHGSENIIISFHYGVFISKDAYTTGKRPLFNDFYSVEVPTSNYQNALLGLSELFGGLDGVNSVATLSL